MELPRQVWESTQISSGSEILYTCGVQAKFLTALAFFFLCPGKTLHRLHGRESSYSERDFFKGVFNSAS